MVGSIKIRQSFDNAFKVKVVLKSLREELSFQKTEKKYRVHPNQISLWTGQSLRSLLAYASEKTQAIKVLPELFDRQNKKSDQQ